MSYIIDQPNCSCCHRCEVECPVHAISMKNRKYWIDPEVCISCGECAKNCHNHAISDEEHPEEKVQMHEKIVKNCDVLVIGGGGSGLTAAAKAADMGKSVVLLEKNWEVGGSAYFGHMMRVHYSKWHKDAGLEDPREKLFEEFKETVGDAVNLKLVHRCLEANAQIADWLIDAKVMEKAFKMGPGRFGGLDLVDNFERTVNKESSDPSIGPGASGWKICELLTDMIKERGGEIICNACVTELLTDHEAVVGALAKDLGGEIEVHAKSVIVTAGTYSRNKEIMDKMQPIFYQNEGNEPVHIYACSTCTGDGITMCEKIGADIDYKNKRSCMFGPIHHPYSYSVLTLDRIASKSVLLVGKYGQYIDNTNAMAMTEIGLLADKPGRMGWDIIDQQCLDEALEFTKHDKDADAKMSMSYLNRDLPAELKAGSVVKADTIEELAKKLHCEESNLKEAFEIQKNEIEKKMQEPEKMPGDGPMDPMAAMMASMPKPHVLKNGPFYAIHMGMFQENAIGGMTIDENTAVLKQGKEIPNLYAAGDNTRGIMVSGDIGVGFIERILSAMTYAMCSGYIAAVEAVKNADK